jgi:hypothetical protein
MFSGRWRCPWWSESWLHVDLYVGTSVSEEHTTSNFSPEDGSMLLRNVGAHLQARTVSQPSRKPWMPKWLSKCLSITGTEISVTLVKMRCCTVGTTLLRLVPLSFQGRVSPSLSSWVPRPRRWRRTARRSRWRLTGPGNPAPKHVSSDQNQLISYSSLFPLFRCTWFDFKNSIYITDRYEFWGSSIKLSLSLRSILNLSSYLPFWFSKWPLSKRFPHQNFLHISLVLFEPYILPTATSTKHYHIMGKE